MKALGIWLLMIGIVLLAGCTSAGQVLDGDGMEKTYHQISQEEAREMMAKDDGHVVVDVRRQEEYDVGHIPGAILIPNESIDKERPKELPDLDQIILIYCRSGNRSKQAAQKLLAMGYTNLYEFGGINTWTGEIVKGGENAVLTFDSFDGGGPDFTVVMDTDIVSYQKKTAYRDPNHAEMEGSGFDVIFTFAGEKPGEAQMVIEERSPIGWSLDHVYAVKVDEGLNVTITLLETRDLDAPPEPVPTLVIHVNNKVLYASLADNEAADAFAEKLSKEAIEVKMKDYGSFEKVGDLPWELPTADEQLTMRTGDILLYQGKQITIGYDQNTWEYTRLARIEDTTREELLDAFGEGDADVAFWVEWSE